MTLPPVHGNPNADAPGNVGDDTDGETDARNVRDDAELEVHAVDVRNQRVGSAGVNVRPPEPPPPPDPTDPPPPPLPNQAPIAVLTLLTSPVVDVELTVSTVGTQDGDGTILSGSLNWGDGSAAVSFTGAPADEYTHTYTQAATYTITLSVIDNRFAGDAATALVTVVAVTVPENDAPIARLTFVSGEFTGDPVVLSTAGTEDPDGTIADWEMDWDDGTPDSDTGDPPATLDHTYATAGTYTATFTVTDDDDETGSVTMDIVVQDPLPGDPPTATLELLSGDTLGDSFVFAIDGHDPDAGTVTWSLNYGDGTSTSGAGSVLPTTRSRTYTAAGVFTATFRVTDTENLTTTQAIPVTVDPLPPAFVPPVAVLTYVSGQYRGEPYVLSTDGTSVKDDTLASGSLNWGDGTSPDTWTGDPTSPYTHTYQAAGTYTATLTVVSTGGNLTATATRQVVIESRPVVNQPPTASLALLSGQFVNDTFVVSTSGSFDPDGTLAGGFIDWGDNTADTGFTGPPASTYSHVYTSTGTKSAVLTVTDAQGVSATDQLNITVSTAPTPGSHPYFDLLVSRPDRMYAWPLRSASELAGYPHPTREGEIAASYDAGADACLFSINPSVTGINEPGMIFLPLVVGPNTSFLMTFDQKWDSAWAYEGAGYLPKYKALRFDCAQGSQAPAWVTWIHNFQDGQTDGALMRVTLNQEFGGATAFAIAPTTLTGEIITPQTYFRMQADRWVRTWLYYNAPDQEMSVWQADTVQGTVQTLTRVKWAFPTTGLIRFRLEFDTSSDNTPVLNDLAKAWFRNVVVLSGVSYATAQSLLSTTGLTAATFDYYVATPADGGNDSNNGTSISTPVATISKALQLATAALSGTGKTIAVRGGTYTSAIANPSNVAGTSWTNKLRVSNYNNETVWIRPTSGLNCIRFDTGNQKYVEFDGINCDGTGGITSDIIKIEAGGAAQPHHIRVKNADLKGSGTLNAMGVICTASDATAASTGGNEFINLIVHNIGIWDSNHAFYIQSSNNLIENCNIYDIAGAGIQNFNGNGQLAQTNTYRNNYIHDLKTGIQNIGPPVSAGRHQGLIIYSTTAGVRVYNNVVDTIPNNGAESSGIEVSGSNVLIASNTIYGVAGTGIRIISGGNNTIRNNISYNNTSNYAASVSVIEDHNSRTGTDPRFVNASAGDFHLTATTPTSILNAGTTITVITTDKDNIARGNPPDIGAYEQI